MSKNQLSLLLINGSLAQIVALMNKFENKGLPLPKAPHSAHLSSVRDFPHAFPCGWGLCWCSTALSGCRSRIHILLSLILKMLFIDLRLQDGEMAWGSHVSLQIIDCHRREDSNYTVYTTVLFYNLIHVHSPVTNLQRKSTLSLVLLICIIKQQVPGMSNR